MHWGCYYTTSLGIDVSVDPQRRCFGCSESDFALQRGTREEPGALTQGGALFSLVPLVWELAGACVFITAVPITKIFARGVMEDMCYERLRAEAGVN